ncbi:P-loop containing nucleoside triphosphate hydrolase protein [Microstroma glucosiphilum]|uniref:DNA helicase n=1 Tax=Pseudomicrostroma glucosiphilum TaxID=1684307 RepID=A0A316U313_9BASI|nr:P-loop containing nucleoside triphosphate hydrolase protein [Pseudomicrostroma glucosiphilum]PWN19709.1 P-loop containing nucleoside triphosphate hydrolase protein [Pseudomicrostroma glucosiphilum]
MSSSSSSAESADGQLIHPRHPTPLQLQSWLQRHLTLLQRERSAELEESHLLLSSVSPRVLETNGLALCRLGVLNTSIGMGGKSLVELHRPTAYHTEPAFPPNGFRSGDVVVIVDEAGSGEGDDGRKKKASASKDKALASENTGVDGVVVRVAETKITIAIGKRRRKGGDDGEEEPLPARCRVVKVANEVTWERMEKNLIRLASKLALPVRTSRGIRGGDLASPLDGDSSSDDEAGPTKPNKSSAIAAESSAALPAPPSNLPHLPHLLESLVGLRPPSRLPKNLPAPPLPLFNKALNDSQTAALSRALAAPEIHLIHGPPGTGKTTVLVELILQLVLGRGERVLVAGSSNLAVDNLAAKLLQYRKGREKDIRAVRVGHPARILPVLQNHTLDHLSASSDSGQLLSDTRSELQAAYSSLSAGTRAATADKPAAGNKSTSRRGTSSASNKRLNGSERKRAWEEVRALRGELKSRERGLFTTTLAEANIVMSTLHGASGGVLERSLRGSKDKEIKKFDTVIIDEACQALEASSWGAILDKFSDDSGAGRLILAGDDKQLGPVVKSEDGTKQDKKTERKSKTKTASSGKNTISLSAIPQPSGDKKPTASGSDKGDSKEATLDDETAGLQLQDDKSDDDGASIASSDERADGDTPEGDAMLEQPTAASEEQPRPTLRPPRSLSTTLFTRLISLYGSSAALKSLLTVQYRMNSQIMQYPNKAMYRGQLVAHESCRDGWIGDGTVGEWKGEEGDIVEVKGGRVVFYDTAGSEMYENIAEEEAGTDTGGKKSSKGSLRTDSKSNAHEVSILQSHLGLLIAAGIPTSAVTILAPYSAQISLISSTLSSALSPEYFAQLEIGTIDALQGREKDVVMISLTRSNEEGEVGFLKEIRRLNVAMTRAKRQLVVVGDSETVSKGGKYLREWMEWLDENAVVEPILP